VADSLHQAAVAGDREGVVVDRFGAEPMAQVAFGWDGTTITRWAGEMSAWIKSLDKNHMVAMGDEGFINAHGGQNFNNSTQHEFYQTGYGIDTEALTALPDIDFGTYHLYPDHWDTRHGWDRGWIEDHIEMGRRVGKPMVLEEYGMRVRRTKETFGPIIHGRERRELAYINWNNLVLQRGGAASMFWILSGKIGEGKLYPDHDHFTVYRDDESFQLLKEYSDRFRTEAQACLMAEGADHGPISAFVSARPAPRRSWGADVLSAR
jgi:mannan endo-1,4-beta-mannosidase